METNKEEEMNTISVIVAMLWGGCFGFAMSRFFLRGDWGMGVLVIGMFIAIYYIIFWMIRLRFEK